MIEEPLPRSGLESLASHAFGEALPVVGLLNVFTLSSASGDFVVIRIDVALAHTFRLCMTRATFAAYSNDFVNSSSIARLPFSPILRVPVPVKCGWVMTGVSRFVQSLRVHSNQASCS